MPTIYLDACCLNRPFDDQTQSRIHLEAEAVLIILVRLSSGEWRWLGSSTLDFEIDQIPDDERRTRIKLLAANIQQSVSVHAREQARAKELIGLGLPAVDALHLACAESGGAEIFLTTDDRLLRQSARLSSQLRVRVENPLTWLKEVTTN